MTAEKDLRQGCSLSPILFKIFLHTALLNWNKKCTGMDWIIGEESKDTIYAPLLADDQVLIAQKYEDMGFMVRN